MVNDGVRIALGEDAEDMEAFATRRNEKSTTFESFVRRHEALGPNIDLLTDLAGQRIEAGKFKEMTDAGSLRKSADLPRLHDPSDRKACRHDNRYESRQENYPVVYLSMNSRKESPSTESAPKRGIR